MISVFLTKIKTRDGLTLDGIYVKPKKTSSTALIWIHGLTSRFYSSQDLIKELSQACSQNNIGYFKFNTRGHDIAVRQGARLFGSAFERFSDCLYDIEGVIRFARRLGYKKIILAGHSTGANKIAFYLWKKKTSAVKGVILLGPLSDRSIELKKFGKKKLEQALASARKLKSRKMLLMPKEFGFYSPERYISLFGTGSPEDTFPYYNPGAKWRAVGSIRQSLAVIIGSKDEYLDRPAENLMEIFRVRASSTKFFSGYIINGANHGFKGKERELTGTIMGWIRSHKN